MNMERTYTPGKSKRQCVIRCIDEIGRTASRSILSSAGCSMSLARLRAKRSAYQAQSSRPPSGFASLGFWHGKLHKCNSRSQKRRLIRRTLDNMINFLVLHSKQVINTTGLSFDILGAICVATEVIKKYKGPEYKDMGEQKIIGSFEKETKFLKWEQTKFSTMSRGLIYLILGFCLQIISAWL